jgi:hypothetical protein
MKKKKKKKKRWKEKSFIFSSQFFLFAWHTNKFMEEHSCVWLSWAEERPKCDPYTTRHILLSYSMRYLFDGQNDINVVNMREREMNRNVQFSMLKRACSKVSSNCRLHCFVVKVLHCHTPYTMPNDLLNVVEKIKL